MADLGWGTCKCAVKPDTEGTPPLRAHRDSAMSKMPRDETMAPTGRFRDLAAEAIGFGRGRLIWVGLISGVAAVAEGAGLILLLPVLEALGVEGSSTASNPFAAYIGAFATLEMALLAYVVVVAVAAGAVAARSILVSRMRLEFIDALRLRLHAGLISARWWCVARHRSADLMHILGVEVNRTGEGVHFLLRLVGWGLEIPVILVIASALSPELTLLVLVCALVLGLAAIPIDRLTHQLGRRLGPTGRRFLNAIDEDLASLPAIKSFSAERRRIDLFRDRVGELRQEILRQERFRAAARVLAMSGGAMAVAVCVWISLRVLDLALAETLVLVVAMARLLPLLNRMHEGWRQVLVALPAHASARALDAELSEAMETETTVGPIASFGPSPGVRLNNLTVRYGEDERAALEAVSADFSAARHVAIVGASGAGKSTLAHALVGLLAPESGEVLIGDKPLDDANRLAWRRRTALVSQDPVLFNETIADNLRLAKPGASEVELWECLRAADADFVSRLPDGLETVVGERGARLSGGERQRVALARALLAKPALLVLDEPTSALDPAGETAIIQSLKMLKPGTRVVTISHRPALARAANHIVVLREGRVVAEGTWAELDGAERDAIDALGLGTPN